MEVPLAECGKGWNGRCSAAKSKKCRCRCGGVNHGATRQKFEDNSPRRSTDEELYYGCDDHGNPEPVRHSFLPSSRLITGVRFTRIAGEPSPFGGETRGAPVVELVMGDGLSRLRHRYMRHSPDGFEFGYGGSGPAECALNLLAEFIGVKNATEKGLYQDFKFAFIGGIDQDHGGEIDAERIREWVSGQWEARANEPNYAADA
jgi:hypothetical protein